MDPIITAGLAAAVSAAASSIVTSIMLAIKKKNEEINETPETILILLRAALLQIYDSYIPDHRPVPLFAKEVASAIYDDYHKRGGNSTGTYIYNAIIAAPTDEAVDDITISK